VEQRVPVIRRISGIRVIVKRALQEPLRQIVENAGEEGAIVLGKVLESKDPKFGYNALTGEFEDLVRAGVLDPTKSCVQLSPMLDPSRR
jgi:chaperonin GroEL (HSP60 family)